MNGPSQVAPSSLNVNGNDKQPSQEPHPSRDHQTLRAQSEPYQTLPAYTVGYVYSSEMLLHSSLHGHPEQPERISRIRKAIQDAKLLSKMKQIPIRPVYRGEALLVHTQEHWDKVLAIQGEYTSRATFVTHNVRGHCSDDGTRNN